MAETFLLATPRRDMAHNPPITCSSTFGGEKIQNFMGHYLIDYSHGKHSIKDLSHIWPQLSVAEKLCVVKLLMLKALIICDVFLTFSANSQNIGCLVQKGKENNNCRISP